MKTVSAHQMAPVILTTVTTADPISCSGDLCIQNISQNGSSSTIKAWAKTTTFTGHFEPQFPDGVVKNRPNEKWTAGGTGYDFTKVPEVNGYKMTAGKGTSHFVSVGELGFNVD